MSPQKIKVDALSTADLARLASNGMASVREAGKKCEGWNSSMLGTDATLSAAAKRASDAGEKYFMYSVEYP
jgi:hypothetical protein